MLLKLSMSDPAVKLLALKQLMEQIDSHVDELLKQGLDSALLEDLRNRPMRDYVRAAQFSSLELIVEIDEANLRYVFMHVEDERRDRTLKEYFVKHGASAEMLNRLFKMNRDEVQALRDLFLGEAKTGRHPMPSPFEREEIHREWDAIVRNGQGQPTRESLYQLHTKFNQHTISALWQVINEFGTIESTASLRQSTKNPPIQSSGWNGGNRTHRTNTGDGASLSA